MPRHSTKQTKNKQSPSPIKLSQSKKNAPGQGRPKLIEDRVRIVTYIEAEDAAAVDLLGKRSEVARDAILAYIKSEAARARMDEWCALVALGDEA